MKKKIFDWTTFIFLGVEDKCANFSVQENTNWHAVQGTSIKKKLFKSLELENRSIRCTLICNRSADPYNVWWKTEGWKVREEAFWEQYGLNLVCLHVSHELQREAVLCWQVDTIIYSSAQGHFTVWRIRPWARGVADSGALGLLFSCCGCVYSPLSLSSTPSKASMALLYPARGKRGRKKIWGQREKGWKRWGGGRGGAMSFLWPERREGPRDMTDYRRGQSSRPMPRPQRSVMGAGRGMWGTKRGCKQER